MELTPRLLNELHDTLEAKNRRIIVTYNDDETAIDGLMVGRNETVVAIRTKHNALHFVDVLKAKQLVIETKSYDCPVATSEADQKRAQTNYKVFT